jgi:hypothetical protein
LLTRPATRWCWSRPARGPAPTLLLPKTSSMLVRAVVRVGQTLYAKAARGNAVA